MRFTFVKDDKCLVTVFTEVSGTYIVMFFFIPKWRNLAPVVLAHVYKEDIVKVPRMFLCILGSQS